MSHSPSHADLSEQQVELERLRRRLAEETDRREQAEARLAQLRFLHADQIIAAPSDAVFTLDNDLVVTSFNPAAELALGRRASDVVGRQLFEAFPEARGSIFEARYCRALATRRADRFEFHFDVPPYRNWYDVRVLPHATGLTVLFRLTTERRRMEAEAKASRSLLDVALDAQLDTFFLFNPTTGRAVRWNRAFREISGYSDEEIAALPAPASYYGPADVERAAEFVAEALAGRAETIELALICKDGRRVPTEYRVGLVPAADGSPSHLISIGRDVSARKRAEQRLQSVFESFPDYLVLLDREHRVRSINRPTEGWSPAAEVGKPLPPPATPEGHEEMRAALDRAVRQRECVSFDAVYRRPDGAEVYFQCVAAPVEVAGEVVGSVVSARDNTNVVSLQRKNRQLEDQYRQAQKMEAIGRLAGGVAHDFNNLITIIEAYAEMLLEQLPAGMQHHDVQQILGAGQRAASLTSMLLAFSRRQVLQPRVLDLNEVIGALEPMLRRLIGEDVVVTTSLAPGLWSVSADPNQFQQVLMNLAVNARDAMPDGGSLTISTANVQLDPARAAHHPELSPGAHVVISVTDSGHGMSPELLELIFEPFFTSKETGEGTGLGLAMAYGVVRQSGGCILVRSEPGQGSTFDIYLPRTLAERPACTSSPAPLTSHGKETLPLPCRGNETVLLVEDEPGLRYLIPRLLESAGYRVLVAADGEEALRVYRDNADDVALVLTDVVMPGMGGRELVERLTAIWPAAKVLYMSGYTDDDLAHHRILDPQTHFLGKPFTRAELLPKLRAVLDGA